MNSKPKHYAIIDTEVSPSDHKVHDIGVWRYDGAVYHGCSREAVDRFLEGIDFVCGHNIIHHDARYLFTDEEHLPFELVDTLYVSPLLFPERPYHRLLKDDKLISEQMNNPVNDCEKARDLLMDEVTCWQSLSDRKRRIFATLLHSEKEFQGFMHLVEAESSCTNLAALIWNEYRGRICQYADVVALIEQYPVELAYALSLIDTTDNRSITPGWVLHNYPGVEYVIGILRQRHCQEPDCEYCHSFMDIHTGLKTFFGYDQFRTYEGEPLQERAARAAVEGRSLLAIFPTGGGKSLTFQLPALMAGRTVHGLTVVISPLQSLMKDQVDNLAERGITDAVTINGLLDPITRSLAIQRVLDGEASLLYIAPEMLRSKTIEKILLARHVVRFVIDEAHCFSSWGQDFRVDYLYIGKFIREYQRKKGCWQNIPVSCFTATAKQKVIQDICDYFKQTLYLNLELYASRATRTNLRYAVLHADTDEDKYQKLRTLLSEFDCPAIVYVARTRRTHELAARLTRDGYRSLPFNGKMDNDEKVKNQDEFMSGQVRIIVATSAFGMGVDKKDVGLVVHYNISDSLENYVQEAGRAGRDPSLSARCYVLYSDSDLDKHFVLLNQTKLSISEIQQVWQAVKRMTRQRQQVSCSSLEIARQAGWSDAVPDIETRVRTAIAALEQAGYLERGNNMPHVYATGITVRNMEEARQRIMQSVLFDEDDREKAVRIIKSLISQKHIAKAQDAEAESRVDYLADILGLTRRDVVSAVVRMRQEGILADNKDITAYLSDTTGHKSVLLFERFAKLEQYILERIPDGGLTVSCKQLNDDAVNSGITTAKEKDIRTLLYFLVVKGYIRKQEDPARNMTLTLQNDGETTHKRSKQRWEICRFAIKWLYEKTERRTEATVAQTQGVMVQFSIVELLTQLKSGSHSLFDSLDNVQIDDVEEALLYLSNIGVLKLDGGFMVLYNAMDIHRLKDMKLRYKQEDYRMLDDFYKQKIQQVHIVGEYANLMVRDYQAAQQYVQDYFLMDYRRFIARYFKGERNAEIQRNVTPAKYKKLFAQLSESQRKIIADKDSNCIVVAAGPGSGKTRVLVHKLASLLLLEDVKHEQLLMLTFSRAAATEFKQRLIDLIGEVAYYVEIKTFHSYSFDILGRVGNLEAAENVVARAAEMISQGEVEPNRIGKTVLVIDEAQDMSVDEYKLVKALMAHNEDMRVIAVGDDDQNIFEFRGSDSKYLYQLSKEPGSRFVEMTENYRSSHHVVDFANAFARCIGQRMKSTPIVSMSSEDGLVEVTHHTAQHLFQPVINDVLRHQSGGTSCILTQTNEEAVILMALLRKHGIKSKLVQSIDDIRFANLAEIKYMLRYISKRLTAPLIPDELWEEAKQATFRKYEGSQSLPYVRRCIQQFEQTNRAKYRTDLWEFIYESSVEDFCEVTESEVVVSTIHKSKGREFNDVYMLMADRPKKDNRLFRQIYVGITRAKQRLFIHSNSDLFSHLPADQHTTDNQQYPFPDEIVLQLTHKDVNLGFFKPIKQEVLALRSGDPLILDHNYFLHSTSRRAVAKLSQAMQTTLASWLEKGYTPHTASVRFVVAWKPKDAPKDEPETAVLLIDLELLKS
ncbi:MAG: RecQ family ATP-dependent DNA helicase [Prevotella sp.]|nr:RecQ family ATP-dependent DNA helicase [Prevotella sp.]